MVEVNFGLFKAGKTSSSGASCKNNTENRREKTRKNAGREGVKGD
jgi:hypothetical protein